MRGRAYCAHPSIRDHWALRCMSRCLDQVVSLKLDPQCSSSEEILCWTKEEVASYQVFVGVEVSINSRRSVYEEGIMKPQRLARIFEQQDLLNQFWKKWSKKYLLQLRTFHQVCGNQNSFKIRIGDVVLLQEDVTPRDTWKRARMEELILGRDEKVRTSVLRTNGHTITRPVKLVIPPEVDQGGEDVARLNSTRSLK
ncbi:DUF5641 domain-containing protein [Trichonephila clavipes]|nr:DUF5641 domain-containing protein [Trichonephila clavipes]